jgi:hypothetical protein
MCQLKKSRNVMPVCIIVVQDVILTGWEEAARRDKVVFGKKQSAAEALQSALKAQAEFGPRDVFWRHEAIARNVLQEDLGEFSDLPKEYGDDPHVICRLAAHARQDASHAVLNTNAILREVQGIKRVVWMIAALIFLLIFKLFG